MARPLSPVFRLPEGSGLSLRDQVVQVISAAIAGNALPPDLALPSCRELSAQMGVSKNTVFGAYARLVEMGLLKCAIAPDISWPAATSWPPPQHTAWATPGCRRSPSRAHPPLFGSFIRRTGKAIPILLFTTRLTRAFFRSRLGENARGKPLDGAACRIGPLMTRGATARILFSNCGSASCCIAASRRQTMR